jgi:hypothetical protein
VDLAAAMAPQGFQFYHYIPSLPVNSLFVVLFALPTALHLYQIVKRRSLKPPKRTLFMIPFFIGGLLECSGYIARIASHYNREEMTPFIIQSLFLLIAPGFLAASVYMTFSRLVESVEGDDVLLLRRRWVTTCFVGGDIMGFMVQSGGTFF